MAKAIGWYGFENSGVVLPVLEMAGVGDIYEYILPSEYMVSVTDIYPNYKNELIPLPDGVSFSSSSGVFSPSADDTIYKICDKVLTIASRPVIGFSSGYYGTDNYGVPISGFGSVIGSFSSNISPLTTEFDPVAGRFLVNGLSGGVIANVALCVNTVNNQYGDVYLELFDKDGNFKGGLHLGAYPNYVYAEDLSIYTDKTDAIISAAKSEPYQPGGNSGFGGGGGNFGGGVPNDNVVKDIPNGSYFGYVGGSMFTHYALTGNQVENFGKWLWTEDLGLSLWKTVMEKIFNETADALVSLMAFPFDISTLRGIGLVDGTIKAGNLPTGIPARILGSPYARVDWGAIQLTEYWGNFLDYAPHTKIELYLPWSTGFVPIDPHQCLPGFLSVVTNIDLQKGTCTHNVFAGNTLLGVYEGQCGYEIPLLASNFSAKLAGATVTAVAGLTMGAAGVGAAASTAIKTASAAGKVGAQMQMFKAVSGVTDPALIGQYRQSLANIMKPNLTNEAKTFAAIKTGFPAKLASASSSATAKQAVNVSRNGSFSGSSAGMSVPYPYVIISRPEQNIPSGYGHFFGYPSNIGIPNSNIPNLGALKGYTEVGSIHLNGIQAIPDELAELDDILKGGFII